MRIRTWDSDEATFQIRVLSSLRHLVQSHGGGQDNALHDVFDGPQGCEELQ